MSKYNRLSCCLLTLLLSYGCGFSTEKRRPEKIQNTIEDRKVKKVSEADIINQTNSLGDSITKVLGSVFNSKISGAYAKGGYEEAARFCSVNAYPLTDSLTKKLMVFVKRVSIKNRNPKNKPNDLEQQVLEAYQYSHDRADNLSTNVQFVRPSDTILYNKPIIISSPLCLNCHGDPTQISQGVKDILKEKYPDDKATGYSLGDLRGMWSVRFLKKEIVKQL